MQQTTNFLTDEVTNVSPEISEALVHDISRDDSDGFMERLESLFSNLFDRNVWAFPIVTEAASNAQALRSIIDDNDSLIYCHSQSQIYTEHRDTIELLVQRTPILAVLGKGGKIHPDRLRNLLSMASQEPKKVAVSISQATEIGTLYTIDEIQKIAEISHHYGALIHMDGSHFANAVSSLNCAPSDISWKAGIDILSFGSSRNGTTGVETVVLFNKSHLDRFHFYYERSGHSFDNLWLPFVQLEAYLNNGVWLKNSAHTNEMAWIIASELSKFPEIRIQHPVETNMLLLEMPSRVMQNLRANGFDFTYSIHGETAILKLVTSINTSSSDVHRLLRSINEFV
jgi:threonine aldolase